MGFKVEGRNKNFCHASYPLVYGWILVVRYIYLSSLARVTMFDRLSHSAIRPGSPNN